MIQRTVALYLNCKSTLIDTRIPFDCIVAFDETAVFIGYPSITTVYMIGAQNVGITTSSISQFRLTWIIGNWVNKTRLQPTLKWKSSKEIPTQKVINGVLVI